MTLKNFFSQHKIKIITSILIVILTIGQNAYFRYKIGIMKNREKEERLKELEDQRKVYRQREEGLRKQIEGFEGQIVRSEKEIKRLKSEEDSVKRYYKHKNEEVNRLSGLGVNLELEKLFSED